MRRANAASPLCYATPSQSLVFKKVTKEKTADYGLVSIRTISSESSGSGGSKAKIFSAVGKSEILTVSSEFPSPESSKGLFRDELKKSRSGLGLATQNDCSRSLVLGQLARAKGVESKWH